MRLLRRLVLILVCTAAALVGGMLTYEPGLLFYQTGMSLQLPAQGSVPAAVEALKKGKERLESEEFRMQAAARLTALQIHHARQLGPSQLVATLEESQASLAGFLSRACTARFDESVPALILSISGESLTLVNAIASVIPELMTRIHESNEAVALNLLTREVQAVLSGVGQADQNLTQVLWNLKGALNTRFADRPISKRGAISPPSSASVRVVSSSASVDEALAAVHGKLSQQVGDERSDFLDSLPSLGNAWQLLREALLLRDRVASLITEASSLFSTVDSAISMESGPLPESLARLNGALLEVRGQREVLEGQSARIITSGAAVLQPTFVIDQTGPQLIRIGGQDERIHYLVWGLSGLGIGVLLSLAGWRRGARQRRRV